MYYSSITNGFYDVSIHGANIPVGAVEITKAKHAELLQGQACGKKIIADENGYPVLADNDAVAKKPKFTSLEFLDIFNIDEQLAIATAAMQSAQVKLWYDRTLAAMFITLDDSRTEAGLDALVSACLLSAERKAEVVEAMQ